MNLKEKKLFYFTKVKEYHLSMFISKEHPSTVNNRLAWTAVNCQFRFYPRCTLHPQLRSK